MSNETTVIVVHCGRRQAMAGAPPGMALVLTEEWLTKYALKEQVR